MRALSRCASSMIFSATEPPVRHRLSQSERENSQYSRTSQPVRPSSISLNAPLVTMALSRSRPGWPPTAGSTRLAGQNCGLTAATIFTSIPLCGEPRQHVHQVPRRHGPVTNALPPRCSPWLVVAEHIGAARGGQVARDAQRLPRRGNSTGGRSGGVPRLGGNLEAERGALEQHGTPSHSDSPQVDDVPLRVTAG